MHALCGQHGLHFPHRLVLRAEECPEGLKVVRWMVLSVEVRRGQAVLLGSWVVETIGFLPLRVVILEVVGL